MRGEQILTKMGPSNVSSNGEQGFASFIALASVTSEDRPTYRAFARAGIMVLARNRVALRHRRSYARQAGVDAGAKGRSMYVACTTDLL